MTWTTRRRSDIGGLAAIAAGSGPLVLMIHGVGLRAEAWAAQIDALAADHRVLALDMPGHGESPMRGGLSGIAAYTDACAAALSEPALIVGHSMGAMIALDMAHRHGDRVRGVAALNAVFDRSASAADAVRDRAASLDGRTAPDPEPTLTRWFGGDQSPERDACRSWLTTVDPGAYKTAYTAFASSTVPRPDTLRALRCPALFATGAEEPNSTPRMSLAMAEHAKDGQAAILAGAAHMMPMTHAAQTSAMLRHFAARVFS